MSIDVIFLGLDGVLFDTEALHLAACNAAFANAGLSIRWTLPALRAAAEVALQQRTGGGRRQVGKYADLAAGGCRVFNQCQRGGLRLRWARQDRLVELAVLVFE